MDLINWRELSRRITGNGQNIRKNKIPKKHQPKVDSLCELLTKWDQDLKAEEELIELMENNSYEEVKTELTKYLINDTKNRKPRKRITKIPSNKPKNYNITTSNT